MEATFSESKWKNLEELECAVEAFLVGSDSSVSADELEARLTRIAQEEEALKDVKDLEEPMKHFEDTLLRAVARCVSVLQNCVHGFAHGFDEPEPAEGPPASAPSAKEVVVSALKFLRATNGWAMRRGMPNGSGTLPVCTPLQTALTALGTQLTNCVTVLSSKVTTLLNSALPGATPVPPESDRRLEAALVGFRDFCLDSSLEGELATIKKMNAIQHASDVPSLQSHLAQIFFEKESPYLAFKFERKHKQTEEPSVNMLLVQLRVRKLVMATFPQGEQASPVEGNPLYMKAQLYLLDDETGSCQKALDRFLGRLRAVQEALKKTTSGCNDKSKRFKDELLSVGFLKYKDSVLRAALADGKELENTMETLKRNFQELDQLWSAFGDNGHFVTPDDANNPDVQALKSFSPEDAKALLSRWLIELGNALILSIKDGRHLPPPSISSPFVAAILEVEALLGVGFDGGRFGDQLVRCFPTLLPSDDLSITERVWEVCGRIRDLESLPPDFGVAFRLEGDPSGATNMTRTQLVASLHDYLNALRGQGLSTNDLGILRTQQLDKLRATVAIRGLSFNRYPEAAPTEPIALDEICRAELSALGNNIDSAQQDSPFLATQCYNPLPKSPDVVLSRLHRLRFPSQGEGIEGNPNPDPNSERDPQKWIDECKAEHESRQDILKVLIEELNHYHGVDHMEPLFSDLRDKVDVAFKLECLADDPIKAVEVWHSIINTIRESKDNRIKFLLLTLSACGFAPFLPPMTQPPPQATSGLAKKHVDPVYDPFCEILNAITFTSAEVVPWADTDALVWIAKVEPFSTVLNARVERFPVVLERLRMNWVEIDLADPLVYG